MNVTVKLPDKLIKAARHRAVDDGVSLSSWLGSLVEREVSQLNEKPKKTLAESLAMEGEFAGRDFEVPRLDLNMREIDLGS